MEKKITANGFGELNEDYTSPFETGELQIKKSFYILYVKRSIDIVGSIVAIVITLPVNIAIGFLTLIKLGRPVFFSHKRPGLGEKPFTIIKFRNMTNDVDENGKLLPPDQRTTKLGVFLRKTSLDELLQFYLIFIGKMSIIGPRPLLMSYLPEYSLEQHRRHAVKPGLECPMPSYETEELGWKERIDNDVWYVNNISLRTDVIMTIRLIRLVFNSKRAKTRSKRIDSTFSRKK